MTRHVPEELSTTIGWIPLSITGKTIPPRDPNEDDEDED
jgi:hypothetical protein